MIWAGLIYNSLAILAKYWKFRIISISIKFPLLSLSFTSLSLLYFKNSPLNIFKGPQKDHLALLKSVIYIFLLQRFFIAKQFFFGNKLRIVQGLFSSRILLKPQQTDFIEISNLKFYSTLSLFKILPSLIITKNSIKFFFYWKETNLLHWI